MIALPSAKRRGYGRGKIIEKLVAGEFARMGTQTEVRPGGGTITERRLMQSDSFAVLDPRHTRTSLAPPESIL